MRAETFDEYFIKHLLLSFSGPNAANIAAELFGMTKTTAVHAVPEHVDE